MNTLFKFEEVMDSTAVEVSWNIEYLQGSGYHAGTKIEVNDPSLMDAAGSDGIVHRAYTPCDEGI